MAQQELLQVRDQELKDRLANFCTATNRHPPAALRAIIQLFFAEGDQIAELRLTQKLWGIGPAEMSAFAEAVMEAEEQLSRGRKESPLPQKGSSRKSK
jgi:hypothetical protein